MTLRTRLALMSGASMLVVFALVSFLLYGLFARSANRALDAELHRQQQSLVRSNMLDRDRLSMMQQDEVAQPGIGRSPGAGLGRGMGAGRFMSQRTGAEFEASGAPQGDLPLRAARRELLAQVVGPGNITLVTSEPLKELGTLDADDVTRRVASTGHEHLRDVTVGDTSLRLLEAPMRRFVVQLAIPRTDTDASLTRLRRLLALIALIATAAAAWLGRWLAGRTLAPIDTLADTAREIERTGDLSRRVPGADQPDELGALATTFNEMIGSIESLQQSQRRFVADASHELRTPITSLGGNLEYLARPGIPEDERSAAWTDVRGDMARLTTLAADLLSLARADADSPREHRDVDLSALVGDACAGFARRHDTHSLRCDVTPVTVSGDPEDLQRVITNLITNAVRYTPSSTTIAVSLARRGADAVLVVEDDGPGMDAADAEHAFDRFRRGGSSHGTDGSGLGLAIVRQVARSHGGDATLDTAPGRGCRFTITLPARC